MGIVEILGYLVTFAAIVVVPVYIICQIFRDYRRRDYAWMVAGLICLIALLLLVPVQTHAIKLDMPP